jgi:hypothetical protein
MGLLSEAVANVRRVVPTIITLMPVLVLRVTVFLPWNTTA